MQQFSLHFKIPDEKSITFSKFDYRDSILVTIESFRNRNSITVDLDTLEIAINLLKSKIQEDKLIKDDLFGEEINLRAKR